MARSKNQDTGDAGEELFRKWARQAGFSAEKFSPDRMGVDFFVEIGPSNTSIPLDLQRSSHALVQVKSTTCEEARARVTVENLKRMVDSSLPCFVLLLTFRGDSDETLEAATMVEIDGTQIARILKATVMGDQSAIPLHERELSFANTSGVQLRVPFAQGFVECVQSTVALGDYEARKAAWRRRAGYGERPTELSLSFDVNDAVQHLLGKTSEMPANIISHVERRFGVARKGAHVGHRDHVNRVIVDTRIGLS